MNHREGLLGLLVAFGIGVLIRSLRLPIPAPPTLYGALMIVGMTAGYLLLDYWMRR